MVKLFTGFAVMEQVDRKAMRLDDPIVVRKQDLSLSAQPIADLVTPAGYRTTIGDLVRRGIVDSDSAANDILMAKLGGPAAVQACLKRKQIAGIRVDRNERDLQTETVGLHWRPEYSDQKVFDAAIAAVPAKRHAAAYRAYQVDPRDTATPAAMATFLTQLADGKLLSSESTRFLVETMLQTVTAPDRLKAGLAPGWTLAHKTGTSASWAGVAAATNDVGLLNAPGDSHIAIAVFVGDSKAPPAQRAALIAKIAALTIASHK